MRQNNLQATGVQLGQISAKTQPNLKLRLQILERISNIFLYI